MPDWEERITRDTEPALRAEHELRYALAAPLVAESELWCDLGCGNGVAGQRALAAGTPRSALLVDVSSDALEQARAALDLDQVATVEADLATEDGVAKVRAAIVERVGDGPRCLTCFETIEHLETFVPLVVMLAELGEQHGFTVVLSVPNDAFWALENPYHQTMWGEGSFEELRRLLPAGHVVLKQVELRGSALVADAREQEVPVSLEPDGVATHFVAAFGPGAARLAPGAAVTQADLSDQRRWERQREADLGYLPGVQRHVRWTSEEFADWRRYIHELETELGRPLSGTNGSDQPQ